LDLSQRFLGFKRLLLQLAHHVELNNTQDIKSPYQYSATTIGEDADLTARKKFTKWWEQKLEQV